MIKLYLGQCVIEFLLFRTTIYMDMSGGEWGHHMASGLKKFYLGQYVMELLQHYRRTMTVESIRWRWWPPGGIWVEKVFSWTVNN